MAELHRVEINEKAPNEIEPTEESKTDEVVETTEEQAPTQERPEWLPEKFSSPEEMAKSYSELEKKMGAGAKKDEAEVEQPQQTEENSEDNTQENSNYNQAVVEASQEFFENDGKLSEDTYKKLEGIGLPRDLVDSYAAGQQALLQSEEAQIKGVAGDSYDAMAEWANEHLPPEEIDAFDEAVTGGTVQQAKLAVQGLYLSLIHI